jgi:hypothetical protein
MVPRVMAAALMMMQAAVWLAGSRLLSLWVCAGTVREHECHQASFVMAVAVLAAMRLLQSSWYQVAVSEARRTKHAPILPIRLWQCIKVQCTERTRALSIWWVLSAVGRVQAVLLVLSAPRVVP